MAYTPKDMTGSLFANTRKTKDTHPNMTGSIRINGVDYWLSGWTKTKDGNKWLSISVQEKESKKPRGGSASGFGGGGIADQADFDNDTSVPF